MHQQFPDGELADLMRLSGQLTGRASLVWQHVTDGAMRRERRELK